MTNIGDVTKSSKMTVAQVASMIRESRWTVLRWIKAGDLPAEKLFGDTSPWIIERADVEQFLAKRAQDAADHAAEAADAAERIAAEA